jgi:hypothetical protein
MPQAPNARINDAIVFPNYLGPDEAGSLANLASNHQSPSRLLSPVQYLQAMVPHRLLDCPPEILIRILTHLSLRTLLRFSLVSRKCRDLSNQSLTHLSLAVFPNRLSEKMARLSRDEITNRGTVFTLRNVPEYPIDDEDTAIVIIPDASALGRQTLIKFHNELISKILHRYASGLRVLDFTAWSLSKEVGDALSQLKGLKCLRLRVSNPFTRQHAKTHYATPTERDIWQLGLRDAWTNLRSLRLQNVDMNDEEDLAVIIEKNPQLQVVVLHECDSTATKIRALLQGLKGSSKMKELHVAANREMCGMKTIRFLDAAWSLKVRLFARIETQEEGTTHLLIPA